MKKKLTDAATAYAKSKLGEEQFKNNKTAVRVIMDDFIAGANWKQQQLDIWKEKQ